MIINSEYAKFRYLEICHEMVLAFAFRGYTIFSIRFPPIFRFQIIQAQNECVIYPNYTNMTKGYSKSYRKTLFLPTCLTSNRSRSIEQLPRSSHSAVHPRNRYKHRQAVCCSVILYGLDDLHRMTSTFGGIMGNKDISCGTCLV